METKDYFEEDIDLRAYLSVIKKWWWLILFFSGISGATACVVSIYKEPIYEADVLMMFGTGLEELNPSAGEMQTSQKLAQTYAILIKTHSILDDTAVALGLPHLPQDMIDASVIPNTQLMRITVTDSRPEKAAAIANELASQLIRQSPQQQVDREFVGNQLADLKTEIAALDNRILAANEAGNTEAVLQLEEQLQNQRAVFSSLLSHFNESATNCIRVVEPARIPTTPTGSKVLNTLLGASVGLMVAVGISFLIEWFDDTIKDQDYVQQKLGLETLGAIPLVPNDGAVGAITLVDNPDSLGLEAYSKLATNLSPQTLSAEERLLLVTSAGPEEGKSTVVANLAAVMAHTRRVIVVDADMRRPSQHKLLDCSNEKGLSTLLGDSFGQTLEQALQATLQATSITNLRVLPSGPVPQNPTLLLRSSKMTKVLRDLSGSADIIMIDSPPAFLSDVGILADMVAGIILVVEVGKTRLKACSQALEAIRKARGNVLGVVLRGISPQDGYYYPY